MEKGQHPIPAHIAPEPTAPKRPIIKIGLKAPSAIGGGSRTKALRQTIKALKEAGTKTDEQIKIESAVSAEIARNYQMELLEQAKTENIIAVMDTGTGKTLVAAMLIKHELELEYARRQEGLPRKLVIFLVPTVPLVFQHQDYLQHQIGGAVMPMCGEIMSNQKTAQWEKVVTETDVVCSTAQAVVEALIHGFIRMDQICLVVFDEAHNGIGDHPYAIFMREHYRSVPAESRPRVLALTASPVNSDSQAAVAIENLEKTLCCKAVTVSNDSVRAHAARAPPTKVEYKAFDYTDKYPKIYEIVHSWLPKVGPELGLRKVLEDAKYTLRQLGPWACARTLCSSIDGLQRKADRHVIATLEQSMGSTNLSDFSEMDRTKRELLEDLLQHKPADAPNEDEITPKVKSLIVVLEGYRQDPAFSGIVFVQRRETAERLRDILSNIDRLKDFLVIDVLVGHSTDASDMQATSMKVAVQQTIVKKFASNQINLLIATKVAEEGLDIRSCKLVVRFDMGKDSMNLVNYIQSRGRARAEDSKFMLMCEMNNWDHLFHLRDLMKREKEVRKEIFSRVSLAPVHLIDDDDEEAAKQAPFTYTVESTGAKVTLTSSMGLLNRFCTALPRDPYTVCRAEYTLTHLSSSGDERVKASVTLPNELDPSLRLITGRPMPSKALACRHAAWQAVKLLHQHKLFNDHLEPIVEVGVHSAKHDADYMERSRLSAGLHSLRARKKKRHFKIKIPDILQLPWVNPEVEQITAYLTVIDITPIQGSAETLQLGILTAGMLPMVPFEFSLWPNLAEVTVRLQSSSTPVTLSPSQYQSAKNYYFSLLSPMLKHKLFRLEDEHWCVLVPLQIEERSGRVDFSEKAAADLIDWATIVHTETFDPNKHKHELYGPVVDDLVVTDLKHYRRKFHCLELLTDKGPFDEVPFGDPKLKCAADYYRVVKDRSTIIKDQPVIRARLVNRKFNMFSCHNIAENEAVEGYRDQDVFLLPQFLQVYPVKQNILRASAILPSILHYIEVATRIDELRRRLDMPCRLPEFITALSTPSSVMNTNYERFETYGDAFLKLAMTLHMFSKFPQRGEGVMTMMTHLMISNDRLFRKGWEKGVPGHVLSTKLTRSEWGPMIIKKREAAPAVEGEKGDKTEVVEKSSEPIHLLSDKQVADTMEAMLGAALVCNGVEGGALALHNLYDTSILVDWKGYLEMQVQNSISAKTAMSLMPNSGPLSIGKRAKLRELEKILGYTFKDPMLLLEGITHPSCTDPRVRNYQRLEFLGDAALGFLAVRHFFYTYPELPPHRLSDLKDAAVNNAFLACVSANLGLHTYIESASVPLMEAISDYCTDLYEVQQKHESEAGTRQKILLDITSLPESRKERERLQRDLEAQTQYWMDLETPKAISDVFEAITGAIFKDSDYDIEVVWAFLERVWRGWVDEYVRPLIVGRHPFREMAGYLRSELGCDSWRVPSRVDLTETSLYVSELVMHGEIVAAEYGPSRKTARRVLAASVLDMIEQDRPAFHARCSCEQRKIAAAKGVYENMADEEMMLEKDEAGLQIGIDI
ncbi:hypothetical protein DFS34DRAFT_356890 [Phlyctochytrium arcticum]|nr:hypothetical protein DFS34DRAFT_356890 [Phlyctochytrium arcticum]